MEGVHVCRDEERRVRVHFVSLPSRERTYGVIDMPAPPATVEVAECVTRRVTSFETGLVGRVDNMRKVSPQTFNKRRRPTIRKTAMTAVVVRSIFRNGAHSLARPTVTATFTSPRKAK